MQIADRRESGKSNPNEVEPGNRSRNHDKIIQA